MSFAKISEAQIYAHVRQLLLDHEKMLADGVRNRGFYAALRRRITPDSVVLDIGAGPGIWAIAAARLGAKRVVALESNELLLGVIKRLARECGVGDQVQPMFGYSTEVQLEREFDLIVSETIGVDGFDEDIVAIMADARTRFLKLGGALIPESLSLHGALGHFKGYPTRLPAAIPLNFPYFDELKFNAPVRLVKNSDVRLLSKAHCLISADLYQANPPFALQNMQAQWQVENSETVNSKAVDCEAVNCIVVWVQSKLTPGVSLCTRRTSSWSPMIYRIKPATRPASTVAFELSFANSAASWTITYAGDSWQESQRYGLEQASREILQDLAHCGEAISPVGHVLISQFGKTA